MVNKVIKFLWTDQEKHYYGNVNREAVIAVFTGLQKGFEENNEISTKLLSEILPTVKSISVNKDFNATQDVPAIYCSMDDGEIKMIKILRHHKIIWQILDSYTTNK